MAKKKITFDKEYLETKIKNLEDQKNIVIKLLNKLEGALEITNAMLTEFNTTEDDKV